MMNQIEIGAITPPGWTRHDDKLVEKSIIDYNDDQSSDNDDQDNDDQDNDDHNDDHNDDQDNDDQDNDDQDTDDQSEDNVVTWDDGSIDNSAFDASTITVITSEQPRKACGDKIPGDEPLAVAKTTNATGYPPSEVTRLGWARKKWFAQIGNARAQGSNMNVRLSYKFVRKNFSQDFIRMCRRNPDKTLPIPVGKSETLYPLLKYAQKSGSTCVQYGLASALVYLGAVTKYGRSFDSDVAALVATKIPIMSVVKNFLSTAGWGTVTIERGFNILACRSPNPTVVQIYSSSGSCSHAVTIVGDFIFDANKHCAVPLDRHGLDSVCLGSDTFMEVLKGFRLIPSLVVVKRMNLPIRDSKKRKIECS
jgi:hypothetical protein